MLNIVFESVMSAETNIQVDCMNSYFCTAFLLRNFPCANSISIIGRPSYKGSYKVTVVLSVHLSVCQFGVFLRNGSIVF